MIDLQSEKWLESHPPMRFADRDDGAMRLVDRTRHDGDPDAPSALVVSHLISRLQSQGNMTPEGQRVATALRDYLRRFPNLMRHLTTHDRAVLEVIGEPRRFERGADPEEPYEDPDLSKEDEGALDEVWREIEEERRGRGQPQQYGILSAIGGAFNAVLHPRGHDTPDSRGHVNPGEFGSGRGAVRVKQKHPGAHEKVLGKSVADHEVAGIAGADTGHVEVAKTLWQGEHPGFSISVRHPDIQRMERVVYRDPSGLVMHNSDFAATEKGGGLGTRAFASQVDNCLKHGFNRIECTAGGAPGGAMNGYVVWPKLGYDGPIPQPIQQRLPPEYQGASRVQELFAKPGGADWWAKNGGTFKATFDLSQGAESPGVKLLNRYLAKKGLPQIGAQPDRQGEPVRHEHWDVSPEPRDYHGRWTEGVHHKEPVADKETKKDENQTTGDAPKEPEFKHHVALLDLGDGGYPRSQGNPVPAIAAAANKIEDADLAEEGRETDFHITVLFGIRGAKPEKVREAVEGFGAVTVTFGNVSIFPARGDKTYDVVKVDVLGADIHRLHNALKDRLPHAQQEYEFHPHVTLAYVKPGKGGKYIGKSGIAGQVLHFRDLALSEKGGTKHNIDLLEVKRHGRDGEPIQYAAAHVPAGYTHEKPLVVQGRPYIGGEFVPAEVVSKATSQEKKALGVSEQPPVAQFTSAPPKTPPLVPQVPQANAPQPQDADPNARTFIEAQTPPNQRVLPKVARHSSMPASTVPGEVEDHLLQEREMARRALSGSPVAEKKPVPNGGRNASFIVKTQDGKVGVYKPRSGEEPMRMGITPGTYYRREVAASRVADALGFGDLVPATVERNIDGEVGSVQQFVPHSVVAAGSKNPWDGERDLARAAVYDYLVGHQDRHFGNWLTTDENGQEKLWLIDNGLAFPSRYAPMDYQGGVFAAFLMKQAYQNDLPLPNLSHWEGRWPDVEKALTEAGLDDGAIRLTRERFDALLLGHRQAQETGQEFKLDNLPGLVPEYATVANLLTLAR